MCGIFGLISDRSIDFKSLKNLATHARQRGSDSSGIIYFREGRYLVNRADYDIKKLLLVNRKIKTNVIMGHSRLITNGLEDNQPVTKNSLSVIHNGIIVNDEELWKSSGGSREHQIDTEIILELAERHLENGVCLEELPRAILSDCRGTVSCALLIPARGKLIIFSNNGSLFCTSVNGLTVFSSERYPLEKLGFCDVEQVKHGGKIIDVPVADEIETIDYKCRTENLIPSFKNISAEEALLRYENHNLKRCTNCILPETMPFIRFDNQGVCNYCKNYSPRNIPKPKEELLKLLEPYRRVSGPECIVPFSGGRDSCWGLHLIVKELGLKPITYTYDWGMVTDLGRRNISRMCAELQVENIIVAADISRKRKNIAKNLKAWLQAPDLGMVSILTAGDKHFFRHVETVKRQTGISLNLWGINPLEVTHFKAGFLGVRPDFEEERVYAHGWAGQVRYQWLRTNAMLKSPGYFNRSLWDTLSGEYYRSFTEKTDYYHLFDYWRWDETVCDKTLEAYDWELATDTSTTWRIGDGTAAFYNYIYYTLAGFTEHDTFRSNQVREGQLTRENALRLAADENQPRYENIKWYLDTLGMDFSETIKIINAESNNLFKYVLGHNR